MKRVLAALLCTLLLSAPISLAEEAKNSPEVLTEAVEQSTLLLQLKQKLAQTEYRYYLLINNVETAKETLEEHQASIQALELVISELEEQIEDAEKQILSVKRQKEEQKLELADYEEEVTYLELALEDQKKAVETLMPLLYVKQSTYYDADGVNPVKVLASHESVSETLQDLTYLGLMENEMQGHMDEIVLLSEELEGTLTEIEEKTSQLEALDLDLNLELEKLQEELSLQEEQLEQLEDQSAILEATIFDSDDKEEELLEKMEIYQENIDLMEGKLSGTRGLLSEEEMALIEKIEEDMAIQYNGEDAASFLELDWPVPMNGGITAGYQDSAYQAAFGVPHYAVDIRAKHGTPIESPGNGVVQEVIFNPDSNDYAYVKVIYRMGVSVLFGHVSGVEVEAGDAVSRGQVLAYTGATPGSVGAGPMTTGPHLHMEVFQDGFHVDPFPYFPYEEVPLEFLPDQYVKQVEERLQANIREAHDALTD